MWYISVILMVIAGVFNACMDVLKHRYNVSIFKGMKAQQWTNPGLSWTNKWKNGDPSQGEKFIGSSTFLVSLTDFWHFCKHFMLTFIMLAVVLYHPIINWWADFLILYFAFTATFELFFSKILIKKTK